MKKGLKIHLFICWVFGIVWFVLIALSSRHIVNIDQTPFVVILLILLVSYEMHRETKKGRKIYLFVCLVFGIVWFVLIVLSSLHIVNIDGTSFAGILLILLVSYELHRETKKGLRIHLFVFLVFNIVWLALIVLSSLHIVSIDETLFAVIMLILLISYLLHRAIVKNKS